MDPRLQILGQLVIIFNDRPYYGKSRDGTLGRITRIGHIYASEIEPEHIYVDLYRRHRRTQRPLDLREEFMRTENLRPIDESELEPDQRELVAHFGLVTLAKLAHRAKLRAQNMAWEQEMLARGGWATPVVEAALSPVQREHVAEAARSGIEGLERLLAIQPPEGTEASRVKVFFDQHREEFVAAIVELTARVMSEKLTRKQQRAAK